MDIIDYIHEDVFRQTILQPPCETVKVRVVRATEQFIFTSTKVQGFVREEMEGKPRSVSDASKCPQKDQHVLSKRPKWPVSCSSGIIICFQRRYHL